MLNMDFEKTVVVKTAEQAWQASPSAGVWRKPLAREAAEHGSTTSIVRFDPGCSFAEHSHPLGEEILVLEGVFSDQYGDYPAGTYLRSPPGTKHVPFSNEGCTLFVKLDQFDPDDSEPVCIDTQKADWLPGHGKLQVMPLHEVENESVSLVRWPSNSKFQPHMHFGGEEIYVISGTLNDEYGSYPKGSWIRSPHKSEHFPFVEEETIIWVKTGHLPIN
ncbi:MAG: anti-sigma factor ChrR (cupin superfamily) [Gammaproteobacteria bacterium]|jgi:anti-sigma factor ChrR (cupin superfamily)